MSASTVSWEPKKRGGRAFGAKNINKKVVLDLVKVVLPVLALEAGPKLWRDIQS